MPEHVFKSTSHPEGRSVVLLHARHLVRPLAAMSLPVMIGTLVGMLQGLPVLAFALVGFPAAVLAASAWTHFSLRRTPAEVRVTDYAAAVRSIWEVATNAPFRHAPVLDLRDTPRERTVTVGLSSYDLTKSEWREMPALTEALKQARTARWHGVRQDEGDLVGGS